MTNEDALLALLRDHRGALLRISRFYAGADGEEEDLYQEILAQAWRSWPTFRAAAAPSTWLYRVALNTALTWRRRAGRRLESMPSATVVEPPAVNGARSQAAILWEFLSTLTGPDRSVLVLYMEGLSHQEIAEAMGLSANAIAVRLHRMKQAFTERYVER